MSDAPPTDPGGIELPPDLPRWPKVIGITSIVWGSLGTMCAGCGSIYAVAIAPGLMKGMEAQFGPLPAAFKPGVETIVAGALGVIMTILLIVAGIFLVQYKRLGRTLLLAYGGGSLVTTAIATALQVMKVMEQMDFAKQNPDNGWVKVQNPMYALIGAGVGVVMGLAWPVFCLIWFGLVKKADSLPDHPDAI